MTVLGLQAALEAQNTGHLTALARFVAEAAGCNEVRTGGTESTATWQDVIACVADIGTVTVNVESTGRGHWAVVTIGDAAVLIEHHPTWQEYEVTAAAADGTYAAKVLAAVFELLSSSSPASPPRRRPTGAPPAASLSRSPSPSP